MKFVHSESYADSNPKDYALRGSNTVGFFLESNAFVESP